MLTQQVSTSLLTATSSGNNLPAGMQIVGKTSRLTIYGNARTLGMTQALSMTLGGDQKNLLPAGSTISLASTAGNIKKNEDLVGSWIIPAGSVLSHVLTNPTGGTIITDMLYILEP